MTRRRVKASTISHTKEGPSWRCLRRIFCFWPRAESKKEEGRKRKEKKEEERKKEKGEEGRKRKKDYISQTPDQPPNGGVTGSSSSSSSSSSNSLRELCFANECLPVLRRVSTRLGSRSA